MSKGKIKSPEQLRRERKIRSFLYYLLLCVVAFVCIFPFVVMILGSFSTVTTQIMDPFFWIPKEFTLNNWITFMSSPRLLNWVKNSLIYTLIPVACCILTCPLVGYILAKKRFKGRNFIFMMFMSMMLIPSMATMVPTYVFYSKLGFINNYWAILVPGFWSISNMFLMRQYMSSVPNALIEAAAIDGSGEFRTYFTIVFPMLKTPIAVMGVFSFLTFWGQFLNVTIYQNNADMYNLVVGVATMVQKDGNFAMSMTSSCVTMIPVFILYVCCQKYFIEGINMSGIKG